MTTETKNAPMLRALAEEMVTPPRGGPPTRYGQPFTLDEAVDQVRFDRELARNEREAALDTEARATTETASPSAAPSPDWLFGERDLADVQHLERYRVQLENECAQYVPRRQQHVAAIEAAKKAGNKAELVALEAELREADEILAQHVNQYSGLVAQANHAILQRKIEADRSFLVGHAPELKTEAGREALLDWLAADPWVQARGYTRDQMSGATDPDAVYFAHRAMKAEQKLAALQAEPGKRKVIPQAARRSEPARPVNEIEKRRAKLRRSGSVDDAYALLQAQRVGK